MTFGRWSNRFRGIIYEGHSTMRERASSVKPRNKRNHGTPMYRDDFPLNLFFFSLSRARTLSPFPCLSIYSINSHRLATRQCFYALNHRGHAPQTPNNPCCFSLSLLCRSRYFCSFARPFFISAIVSIVLLMHCLFVHRWNRLHTVPFVDAFRAADNFGSTPGNFAGTIENR